MAPRTKIVLAGFLLFEGVLFLVYCLCPEWDENLKFLGTVIAAAFALFTFLQRNDHDLYESAREFMKRWNDPGLDTARLEVRAILTDALALQPLIKASNDPAQFTPVQNATRGKLIGVLNFFEELAIATRKKRADERSLYEFFSVTVGLVWTKFKPWIDRDREFGDPSYWCEFEALAKRWETKPRWWI